MAGGVVTILISGLGPAELEVYLAPLSRCIRFDSPFYFSVALKIYRGAKQTVCKQEVGHFGISPQSPANL